MDILSRLIVVGFTVSVCGFALWKLTAPGIKYVDHRPSRTAEIERIKIETIETEKRTAEIEAETERIRRLNREATKLPDYTSPFAAPIQTNPALIAVSVSDGTVTVYCDSHRMKTEFLANGQIHYSRDGVVIPNADRADSAEATLWAVAYIFSCNGGLRNPALPMTRPSVAVEPTCGYVDPDH